MVEGEGEFNVDNPLEWSPGTFPSTKTWGRYPDRTEEKGPSRRRRLAVICVCSDFGIYTTIRVSS